MILIDTSVLINLLRGRENEKTKLFREVIERDIPFGISVLTYQEILQGARDQKEWVTLDEYLSGQRIYHLPQKLSFFKKASELFYRLRRSGITLRGTIDVLIGATAIEHKLYLLHDDKDFDIMQQHISELEIFKIPVR